MRFALVLNNEIKEYRDYPSQPECKMIDGLKSIRPCMEIEQPAYNPNMHVLVPAETIYPDRVELTWTAQERPLQEVKSAKLAQIIKDRDTQRYANVSAWGRNWQADQTSQDLLNGAINLAGHGVPLPAVWRDADNADMLISNLTDLLVIAGVMVAQTQQAYSTSWQRKKAVEIATTVEEVEAV